MILSAGTSSTKTSEEDNDPDDPDSHGTHVAGLAAARTDNGVGISSISWNVKILATSGSNSESEDSIYRGSESVAYLAENGADVINMSWGTETTSQVAAGGDGIRERLSAACWFPRRATTASPILEYPSSLPGVVSVASVGKSDRLATYSNRGISVDISAPGGAGINTLAQHDSPEQLRQQAGNLDGLSGGGRGLRARQVPAPLVDQGTAVRAGSRDR